MLAACFHSNVKKNLNKCSRYPQASMLFHCVYDSLLKLVYELLYMAFLGVLYIWKIYQQKS